MDMGGMSGMEGMGGMDMGGSAMFQTTNKKVAKIYWYFVAAVVALCVVQRVCNVGRTAHARKSFTSRNDVPSRPLHLIIQLYDTTMAICREVTYPQFRPFTGSLTRHFSTLPMGQTLLLLAYWTMILIMLWTNVILNSSSTLYAYKWEIVGFRAAWVSVTQIPLLYCLGGKFNIVSIVTGISHERLNWLHRWVARTIFLTVIVHWSYFFREWWMADFVKFELQMMPMVKYGFGAWSVIGWSVITGFGFFRVKTYELWLLQHLVAAAVLLWLLYVHVPAYARYNIWLSIAFVAFDRGSRGAWSLIRNLHIPRAWRIVSGNQSTVGFFSRVEAHDNGYMTLIIDDVDFDWRPGQHVFVSMPTCGILESHPFTIATTAHRTTEQNRHLQLYLKAHSGFTRRLLMRAESERCQGIRTFVSGPWGNPPTSEIERCNSLVFVASSTGASFTTPLLEHAVGQAKFVQRIRFYWIVRHESQLGIFFPRVTSAVEAASQLGIDVVLKVFVTSTTGDSVSSQASTGAKIPTDGIVKRTSDSSSISRDSSDGSTNNEKRRDASTKHQQNVITAVRSVSSSSQTASLRSGPTPIPEKNFDAVLNTDVLNLGRPQSWDELIHPTIVEAEGETAVIACGGGALMADIRNYVAWISDQRAVHKGTGAQGIFLHTETYGW